MTAPERPIAAAVSNSAFMRELAQPAPRGSTLWIAGFVGNPDLAGGNWAGQPYNPAMHSALVDGWAQQNSYMSVAALGADGDGEWARSKKNFRRLLALVVDDVELQDLQGMPSWVVRTSPGKHQVGLFLSHDDPACEDIELCSRLVTSMAQDGLIKGDKSGNNVVRYVRLPVGTNHKPRSTGPAQHELEAWNPQARYSLADAAGIFGVDLEALGPTANPASSATSQPARAQDALIGTLTQNILRGEHLHDSIAMLAASLVASGTAGGAAVNMIRGLMDSSAAARDDRWRARYADIPRAVSTAQAKYAPAVTLSLLERAAPPFNEEEGEASTDQATSPSDVPAHLLSIPGILGRAVAHINATARKPQPLFAVQAALALGSAVMGRRWRTDNGNWPALYFLNVGLSGGGKEHAKHAVESLLEAAGLGRLIGVGRFVSESSVVSSLIEKPAQFSVLDEFGKTLQSASIAQNYADRNTLKALMETWGRCDGVLRPAAYSTAGLSSKQAEDLAKRCVRKPSLTILAMTTPDTLFAGLTSSAVSDGFLNRFVTVYADRGRQVARTVGDIEPDPGLLDWMRESAAAGDGQGNLAGLLTAHDMDPTPSVLAFDAGALRVFSEMEHAVVERMNQLDREGLAEMLTRRTEMAMRVSLIVARSNRHAAVLKQDATWARDYVLVHGERDLLQLRDHLADGPFDQLRKDVLRLVTQAGAKGMTLRDLDKSCRSWRAAQNPRMQQDVIAALERRGQIVLTLIPSATGRGRQRHAYVNPKSIPPTNADDLPTGVSAQ